MLRLPEHRRQVYFCSTRGSSHLEPFLQHCSSLKLMRQRREQQRLDDLCSLHLQIEIRRKFTDWYLLMKTRQLRRRYCLWRTYKKWWQSAMLKRYASFMNILLNPNMIMKRYLCHWYEVMLMLRAVEFNNRSLMIWSMKNLKKWVKLCRRKRMREAYDMWLSYYNRCCLMKKMWKLQKCLPSSAFRHWKRLTFRKIDLSDLLEQIRLRTLRDIFGYLRDTADARQHARVLEGLVLTSTEEHPEPEIETSRKKKRIQRKAALDNVLTSCDCVAKVCRGDRPTCSFKVHFRRRVNLCYDEYDSAVEDKKVAKEINHIKSPLMSPSPDPEIESSAFDLKLYQNRLKKNKVMSPERKRKIAREKVRGGVRKAEPLSHWPRRSQSIKSSREDYSMLVEDGDVIHRTVTGEPKTSHNSVESDVSTSNRIVKMLSLNSDNSVEEHKYDDDDFE